MSKKTIIVAIIILIVLVGVGVGELLTIHHKFAALRDRLETAEAKALNKTLTLAEYDNKVYWGSKPHYTGVFPHPPRNGGDGNAFGGGTCLHKKR